MSGGICGPPEATGPIVDAAERLHLDIWPAEVFHPDAREVPFRARVFVTDRRVVVWTTDVVDGRETVPRIHTDVAYTNDPPERQRGTFHGQLRLETDQGTVYVTRATGCGCGSPLKALDPPSGW